MAVLFRVPVHEVARWPAWEVRLLEQYLNKQPAPEERLEIAVATLMSFYVNQHLREGVPQKSARDFLPYRDPWSTERYSALDLEMMSALGVRKQ